jgi:hypothetical protein
MELGFRHLKAVGLSVEEGDRARGEHRITIRLGSSEGPFVAWFQSSTRYSGGVPVVGINSQFARLPELNAAQVDAVEHFLAANHQRVISKK